MRSPLHPAIIAHRGLTEFGAIENTADAIQAAIDRGVVGVEFDVRRTRDGVWVVHHDATLERVLQRPNVIAENDWGDLERFEGLDRLEEILVRFGPDCVPFVEVKEPEADGLDGLASALDARARVGPVIAIARGREMPAAIAGSTQGVQIYLYSRDWREAYDRSGEELAGYDLPWLGATDEIIVRVIERAERRGQRVAVWTVNEADEAECWLDRGARWIITDRPVALTSG
ncbi:MAG: glycerophosphodiester phosphodiesterase [Planctomycetota bacterium]